MTLGLLYSFVFSDPDQSIYGFRNANIANFKMMLNDFNETRVVHLEENYRSTSSILNGALHIIRKGNQTCLPANLPT